MYTNATVYIFTHTRIMLLYVAYKAPILCSIAPNKLELCNMIRATFILCLSNVFAHRINVKLYKSIYFIYSYIIYTNWALIGVHVTRSMSFVHMMYLVKLVIYYMIICMSYCKSGSGSYDHCWYYITWLVRGFEAPKFFWG